MALGGEAERGEEGGREVIVGEVESERDGKLDEVGGEEEVDGNKLPVPPLPPLPHTPPPPPDTAPP